MVVLDSRTRALIAGRCSGAIRPELSNRAVYLYVILGAKIAEAKGSRPKRDSLRPRSDYR